MKTILSASLLAFALAGVPAIAADNHNHDKNAAPAAAPAEAKADAKADAKKTDAKASAKKEETKGDKAAPAAK